MQTLLVLLSLIFRVDEPQVVGLPPITLDERNAFEAWRVDAGKDPDKLIKLALWAESKGLSTEREALLKAAAEADPKHEAAWGLLGLMHRKGQVKSPEEVAREVLEEESRALKWVEYCDRRDQLSRAEENERAQIQQYEAAGQTRQAHEVRKRIDHQLAPAQYKLGVWCQSNGMKPEAQAHFTAAVIHDPSYEPAWHSMGYLRHNGRWMTPDQIAADKRELASQHEADRHWGTLLSEWKTWLAQDSKRASAEQELARVNDPRAVPSIIKVLVTHHQKDQEQAVALLGRIDTPASTRELADLAVRSEFEAIRLQASRCLKGRDPLDFAEKLVRSIHTPWTYQLTPVQGPGTHGQLVIDSPLFHLIREYDAPPAFKLSSGFHGYVGIDPNGLPVVISGSDLHHLNSRLRTKPNEAEAILEAAEWKTAEMLSIAQSESASARHALMTDLREIKSKNAHAAIQNARVKAVLSEALDAPESLGDDEIAWNSWYYEKIGYRYTPEPKVTYHQSYPVPRPPTISSCFAAGTSVRTLEGLRNIELLKVGDQVLCQDPKNGSLSYQPILVVHHNPPDKTFAVALENGDRLMASRFHRFWIAGEGWVMAKDLKAGDVLRTLGSVSRVRTIATGPTVPVFNLDVAGSHTYFVGQHDALVHDNTLPAKLADYFDARAEPKALAASKP